MNGDKIKRALPQEKETGRRSLLLHRPDVVQIVVDLVLQRRTMREVAKRTGVDFTTVQRFKKSFITDQVRKLVILEDQKIASAEIDEQINAGQDDVQSGLRGIIKEQKDIYKLMKDRLGDRDIEDIAPALGQLLRDQGQSFERLLKSYTALKDKTTITLSINESPEWSQLQEVLYTVFDRHPEAFCLFSELVQERRLRLE